MNVYIFTGPSLPKQEARKIWSEPAYLAPVAQGDVYQIARRKPWGIGIIDGFFERIPSVWHKEILWALSEGIHVYGSASMGALRAAELSAFGMIGVGTIYEDYASGALADDDEVTLAHAPAGKKYRAVSEPMVNIRRTLSKAVADGIVSGATADSLVEFGKALFYPLRTYERILEEGVRGRLPAGELHSLLEWLPAGRVDQKRLDAIAMLHRMREDLQLHPQRKPASFSFECTMFWDRVRRKSSGSRIGRGV
jgi:hypothetical protein